MSVRLEQLGRNVNFLCDFFLEKITQASNHLFYNYFVLSSASNFKQLATLLMDIILIVSNIIVVNLYIFFKSRNDLELVVEDCIFLSYVYVVQVKTILKIVAFL